MHLRQNGAPVATDERIELDLRAMRCPLPIFEIAKASRQLSPGQELVAVATDPAFPLDVEAWCRKTGFTLVSLEKEPELCTVTIRSPEGA